MEFIQLDSTKPTIVESIESLNTNKQINELKCFSIFNHGNNEQHFVVAKLANK